MLQSSIVLYVNHIIYLLYMVSVVVLEQNVYLVHNILTRNRGGRGGFQESLFEQRFWRETAGEKQRQPKQLEANLLGGEVGDQFDQLRGTPHTQS